jgi:hypothetical protein
MKHNINSNDWLNRREFLKKSLRTWLWIAVSGSLITTLSRCGDGDWKEDDPPEDEPTTNIPLKKKPINLWYKKIVEDKDIDMINLPKNKYNELTRITKCLRRKPITDAVEDRYHIPRWLLMAMMAQEWMWDPAQPNELGDWWLWLIHIQWINAKKFWLHILPIYTDDPADFKHWEEIKKIKKKYGNVLEDLIKFDDRFHPIMAVDCSARFLADCKKKSWNGKDSWMIALKRYSWRPYSKIIRNKKWDLIQLWYWYPVLQYRAAINNITWDWYPKNFSNSVKEDLEKLIHQKAYIKNKLENLEFTIGWEPAWYNEYLAYFEESMKNFELERYVALWDSVASSDKKDVEKLPESKQEEIKSPQKTKGNSLIKEEFVNTRQHNSEWFTLYRYKVKAGDNALKLSDKFDEWDKKHGNKYKNTGNLNIVNFKWIPIKKLIPGEVVYIKAKA